MKQHQLEIQGHVIAAYEYNDHIDSTPLIFLHGIGSTIHFWDPVQIRLVREQYHWYSLTLPGHYPASVPRRFRPEDLTPELVASVLSEAVRQLTGGNPTILIGYSTGGFASYCIAHNSPELVTKLVIVDGFSRGTWYGALRLPQVIASLPIIWKLLYRLGSTYSLSSPDTARKAFLSLSYDKAALSRFPNFDNISNEMLETVRHHDTGALATWYRVMQHTDIGNWLEQIKLPVHLIHGDNDTIILPEHAEEMKNLLPNNTLTWIEGSGHIPMMERPAEYESALTKAISGN